VSDEKVKGKRWPRWAFWTRMFIPCRQANGDVYLARLRIIQTPWFGVYLHDIYHPDVGAPHNHPWSFISIVLRGSYFEHVYPDPLNDPLRRDGRRRGHFSIHRMNTRAGHLIRQATGDVKTLILVGPRRSEGWGFFELTIPPLGVGGSPHREYISWQDYEVKHNLPGSIGSGASVRQNS
jgi:hypothetical protein